ncbi:hypothetical protein C7W88_00025 [Novosphingobium sp. THN1]|uniref:hypothetical protein n=1 Tax=Novosphingobium sp. THN1 TaxID=1016987 RepID=UPI000E4EB362|nr:hypothetical protein [Novosphingobium sp. THN1]AXU17808.1 hypothetical protein C7W88_00025 [Novosphingobium sp. THN1]
MGMSTVSNTLACCWPGVTADLRRSQILRGDSFHEPFSGSMFSLSMITCGAVASAALSIIMRTAELSMLCSLRMRRGTPTPPRIELSAFSNE